jgi:hypothetical protein
MATSSHRALRRKIVNISALSLATLATVFGLIWLVWIPRRGIVRIVM